MKGLVTWPVAFEIAARRVELQSIHAEGRVTHEAAVYASALRDLSKDLEAGERVDGDVDAVQLARFDRGRRLVEQLEVWRAPQ